MTEIQIADKPTLNQVNTKIGTNSDATGTSTLFARLAQIVAATAGIKTMKTAVYRSPGTYSWSVPAGVTEVFITATGAGGSGAANNGSEATPGNAGGITSFGSLLSLSGGSAGSITQGSSTIGGGGGGGGIGGGYESSCNGGSGFSTGGTGGAFIGGHGSYGAGGGGGGGNTGGGGAGDYVYDFPVTVTPGASITITIGNGGTNVSGNQRVSGCGGNGYMLIKWWQ